MPPNITSGRNSIVIGYTILLPPEVVLLPPEVVLCSLSDKPENMRSGTLLMILIIVMNANYAQHELDKNSKINTGSNYCQKCDITIIL